MSTSVTPRDAVPVSAQQQRADRAAHALAQLFERRPELRGVRPSADLVEDAIRWCA